MNELKEFKQKRKALKARIKAAKQEVKTLESELKTLRQNAQHEAVDDLETWMNKGDTTRSTLMARLVNYFQVCRKS